MTTPYHEHPMVARIKFERHLTAHYRPLGRALSHREAGPWLEVPARERRALISGLRRIGPLGQSAAELLETMEPTVEEQPPPRPPLNPWQCGRPDGPDEWRAKCDQITQRLPGRLVEIADALGVDQRTVRQAALRMESEGRIVLDRSAQGHVRLARLPGHEPWTGRCPPRPSGNATRERIVAAIRGGAMTIQEVIDASGLTVHQVRDQTHRLAEAGRIVIRRNGRKIVGLAEVDRRDY